MSKHHKAETDVIDTEQVTARGEELRGGKKTSEEN